MDHTYIAKLYFGNDEVLDMWTSPTNLGAADKAAKVGVSVVGITFE